MELVLHMRIRCGLLPITTPVTLLTNQFDVRSVLLGKVSLAAVNQICVFHGAERLQKKIYRFLLRKCNDLKYVPAYEPAHENLVLMEYT